MRQRSTSWEHFSVRQYGFSSRLSRSSAPFKHWLLPASLERLRRKLQGSDDGDRQMVKVLSAVLTDGLAAVEAGLPRYCRTASLARAERKKAHFCPFPPHRELVL